jgi:dTDP-4-dehydrorhamnose 3,5-epimerase
VAHGYRTLGEVPALIIYVTTEPYDRGDPDEKRIAYDDPQIGFDWSTRMR